jgi:hypothetical protein
LYPAAISTALDVLDDDVSNKIRRAFSGHKLMLVDNGSSDKKAPRTEHLLECSDTSQQLLLADVMRYQK